MQNAAETIRSLRPNVSREVAIRHFTAGARGAAASIPKGRAHSAAELYIPYRLFQVKITSNGRVHNRIYALDSVAGELDLFEFREAPKETDVIAVTTRNTLPCLLDEQRARQLLIDKVRRIVFSSSFARLRDLRLDATAIPGHLYLPYWICFRGREPILKIEILDAIHRRREGAKVRRLAEDWLRSSLKTTVTPDSARSPKA